MLFECIKSTYSLWKPRWRYEFIEAGTTGRYTVFQYIDGDATYIFGLDEALSNETESNYMQFKEVK